MDLVSSYASLIFVYTFQMSTEMELVEFVRFFVMDTNVTYHFPVCALFLPSENHLEKVIQIRILVYAEGKNPV